MEYLILNARYKKVRVECSVRDCAVLIAIGILAALPISFDAKRDAMRSQGSFVQTGER